MDERAGSGPQAAGTAEMRVRAGLGKVAILTALTPAEFDAFAGALDIAQVRPGEIIVRHLERAEDVFFILEGRCQVSLTTPHGRTVAIRELDAGDHFGEIAALTAAPRSVAVAAATPCLIARCSGGAFRAAMAENGAFASEVAGALARSVVALTDRLYELAALETRFRLYAEVLRLARDGEETGEGLLIAPAPTHEAFAAAIGAQRESVTRELGQLANEGVIALRRRAILVRDMAKLRDMVRRRAGLTASQLVDWKV